MMGAGQQVADANPTARPLVTLEGMRRAGADVGLATVFLVAAIPPHFHFANLTDLIWSVGMFLTGLSCIRRPRPSATLSDWRAIISGFGAFVLPPLMARTPVATAGAIYAVATVMEFIGTAVSQFSRVYMGRAFAVMPANRGIVSSGPFAVVRHPVYLGWLMMASGFTLAYPSAHNAVMLLACGGLTLWRISLEEELLSEDPGYRAYLLRVRYRLIPGVY